MKEHAHKLEALEPPPAGQLLGYVRRLKAMTWREFSRLLAGFDHAMLFKVESGEKPITQSIILLLKKHYPLTMREQMLFEFAKDNADVSPALVLAVYKDRTFNTDCLEEADLMWDQDIYDREGRPYLDQLLSVARSNVREQARQDRLARGGTR